MLTLAVSHRPLQPFLRMSVRSWNYRSNPKGSARLLHIPNSIGSFILEFDHSSPKRVGAIKIFAKCFVRYAFCTTSNRWIPKPSSVCDMQILSQAASGSHDPHCPYLPRKETMKLLIEIINDDHFRSNHHAFIISETFSQNAHDQESWIEDLMQRFCKERLLWWVSFEIGDLKLEIVQDHMNTIIRRGSKVWIR